jgi:hypothetical protein
MIKNIIQTKSTWIPFLLMTAAVMVIAGDATAQTMVQTYNYQETNTMSSQGNDLIFGVAAAKICTIKDFLFMAVYVLAAIALVVFVIKALFTRFDFKSFFPILGAIFVVAFADLFIQFISSGQAWYCPTIMSTI